MPDPTPTPDAPAVLKCDHLEARSITIRAADDAECQISISAGSHYAGIWVSNGKTNSQVGLVAERGNNPYLIVYGPGCKFPAAAIGCDKEGRLEIQVVDPAGCDDIVHHWAHHVRFIGPAELAKLATPPAAAV